MKQSSPKWISVLIGFAAFLFADLSYGWLHYKWFDFEDGAGSGWGDWAYGQGDAKYNYLQHLFFDSVYIITGFIAGAVAALGPLEPIRRGIRFACGPGLMFILWVICPVDASSQARHLTIYSCVVTIVFLATAYIYSRKFSLRPAVASTRHEDEQESIWPPTPRPADE